MRFHFLQLSCRILNLFLLLLDRLDDAGACPARSLNEGVRAVRVVYFGNDNPAGRRPLQGCCDIGGPNAPSRAVIKFDDGKRFSGRVALMRILIRFRCSEREPRFA